MHCHCGINNRAPRLTFTDPFKPEERPGAREESASPAWLPAPALNARDTTKVYILRLDTGCGPTLYRTCHSHNTPGKRHNNTWVEPLAGNCTTSSTRQREVSFHNLSRFECNSVLQTLSYNIKVYRWSSTRCKMYVVAYYIVLAMRNESTMVNSKDNSYIIVWHCNAWSNYLSDLTATWYV